MVRFQTRPTSGWPTRWLMTDARLGARRDDVLKALPAGTGVVFRDEHLPAAERSRAGEKVAHIAHSRGLVLGVAGDVALARRLGAALIHRPSGSPGDLPFSLPVHNEVEAKAAAAAGAQLVFVSPIYPTRSHPGQAALGPAAAARLAAMCQCPAIALGGMDERLFDESLSALGFHGWAGIDAWISQRD